MPITTAMPPRSQGRARRPSPATAAGSIRDSTVPCGSSRTISTGGSTVNTATRRSRSTASRAAAVVNARAGISVVAGSRSSIHGARWQSGTDAWVASS